MFAKKTWADRIAEFITRRTLTYEDNSTAVVTVERNEGEVSQVGDAFSAQNMNDLEDRIYDAFEEINTNLTANNKLFKFGYQSGKYGYIIDNVFNPFRVPHTATKTVSNFGTTDMGIEHEYRYINVPYNSLIGSVKYTYDTVDRSYSSWLTVDSWSKYRGFVTAAFAGNGVGGVSWGTISADGSINYTSRSEKVDVTVSGNSIRGEEHIMSNVGVFLLIF